jgi:integrase
MLGLYAGLRREEILALQWDCVDLDGKTPMIRVRRSWYVAHNRPVITEELKTKAARRDVPIPPQLVECLKEVKSASTSNFVIANRTDGGALSGTQWRILWDYITVRSTKERHYYRYVNGQKIKRTVTPVLGEAAPHNSTVVYTIDFPVTPHQLRHTYITNLIRAGVDPKTVQYLAGHENSKITMDIYAHLNYNRPEDMAAKISMAFQPAGTVGGSESENFSVKG